MKLSLLGRFLGLGLLSLVVMPAAQAKFDLVRLGEVGPGVYRGSRPDSDEDFAYLKKKGIKTIVSLQTMWFHRDPEAERAKKFGINFKYVAINGSNIPPSEKHVNEALDLIHDPANWPVYVHCYLGRDRTSMVSALYQVYFMNKSGEAAYHDEMEEYGWIDHWWLHGIMIYYREHDDVKLRYAGRRGD